MDSVIACTMRWVRGYRLLRVSGGNLLGDGRSVMQRLSLDYCCWSRYACLGVEGGMVMLRASSGGACRVIDGQACGAMKAESSPGRGTSRIRGDQTEVLLVETVSPRDICSRH